LCGLRFKSHQKQKIKNKKLLPQSILWGLPGVLRSQNLAPEVPNVLPAPWSTWEHKYHLLMFMSKKFTDMQCSYFTYEHETLGVIKALKKWDDELLGLPEIQIITDHEALKTFMLKAHSGLHQIH
jgi:hypothetical protein